MTYRRHVIENEVAYNEKGQRYIKLGIYTVIHIRDGFVCIYDDAGNLKTHCSKWKRATKTAKLLLDAYDKGYSKALYEYGY